MPSPLTPPSHPPHPPFTPGPPARRPARAATTRAVSGGPRPPPPPSRLHLEIDERVGRHRSDQANLEPAAGLERGHGALEPVEIHTPYQEGLVQHHALVRRRPSASV